MATVAERLEAIQGQQAELLRNQEQLLDQQKAAGDQTTKIILGLMALVAASLGVRFTETDFSQEVMVVGSYLMVAGSTFLLLMWLWQSRRFALSPSIGFLVAGLVGFGLPAMIFGRFWLEPWMVGVLRMVLAVGTVWLALDLVLLRSLGKKEAPP